jgi:hypothetical protein
MATTRIAGCPEKGFDSTAPVSRARRAAALSIIGACALGSFASTANATLLCKTAQGRLAAREVCRPAETQLDPSSFGGGPSPAYHSRVAQADIPSVGWDRLAPVANVFVQQAGRYVILATANVRAYGNGDYVQCDLYVRGKSRGRSVSVVPGLWTGESIALSSVDTLDAPSNVDLRCTDIENAKNAQLTDVRLTAFRVADAPPPGSIPVTSYDLAAISCWRTVRNVGDAASPATTAYFPSCNSTVSVPALSPGQEVNLSGGCEGGFLVDPQGLLNQNRTNDYADGICIY